MRILLFSTAYLPFLGGAELAFKEIIKRLPEIEFDLITSRGKRELAEFENLEGVNIYRIGIGKKFTDKFLLTTLGWVKAANLFRKKRYDLIHGVMASHGSAAAYLFKKLNPRIPFILTLQEGDLDRNSPFDRFWQKRIIKKADVITAISNYLIEFAKKFNKKSPIFLIPNGVDLEKYQISNIKYQNERKGKIIISVSRLVPKNGLDTLIRAFYLLGANYKPAARLLIIGEGPLRKELQELINRLGLLDKVKLLGAIPNEEIPQYLAKADLFVRPSRSEGLGTAFLEAMAAKTPVIATPVGGIVDFLKDPSLNPRQATGLFCESEDPHDLAQKMAELLSNKNLRAGLIRNARKIVEEKYNWDIIAQSMREAYEKVINRNSGL